MPKEYIHRIMDLKDVLEDGSQFLFGPRQTGKSSYIRNELRQEAVLYWNLLDVSLVARIKANPSLLRNQLRMIGKKSGLVILDEIQKVPFLLDEIHSLIEETDFHFLLTGSSARRLREKGVNLLGGRAGVSYMHPLVYPEVKELNFGLEKVFERGLMPSMYLSSRYDILLRNYIKTYLQEEIMEEGITRNLPTFTDFLRIAAINNTEMVNFSNMANDIGVNRAVVTEWYQVLKDSMVITEVPGYGRTRKRKAITKSKYYFFDVGVARKAIGAAPPADGTTDFGKAFENYIECELRAYLDYNELDESLCYWRSASNFEVDFVIGDSVAIETKTTRNPSASDFKGLRALKEEGIFSSYILVCRTPAAEMLNDGIMIMPFEYFLERLWKGEII